MNLNTKVSRMSRARVVDGDVGIEIECETKNTFSQNFSSPYWTLHSDGSLRGNGYEFVLTRPIDIKMLDTALSEWATQIKSHGIKFVDSKRASVHVHCNVQQYKIIDIYNILCAYWLAEPLLLNIAGAERKGNLFCLGINHADTVHSQVVENLRKGKFFQSFSNDAFRYASVNLEALYKFGSLEFRTMRGTQDVSVIKEWTEELHNLIQRAPKFGTPHKIVELISAGKHKKFLRSLFSPDFVDKLIKETGHGWRDKINGNMLLVLDVLAAKDEWDPKKDEELEKKAQEEAKKKGHQVLDDGFWDDYGPHGGPWILGAEVGMSRVRNDRNESYWSVWDGQSWRRTTQEELARQQTDRFIPDIDPHSSAIMTQLQAREERAARAIRTRRAPRINAPPLQMPEFNLPDEIRGFSDSPASVDPVVGWMRENAPINWNVVNATPDNQTIAISTEEE